MLLTFNFNYAIPVVLLSTVVDNNDPDTTSSVVSSSGRGVFFVVCVVVLDAGSVSSCAKHIRKPLFVHHNYSFPQLFNEN